jgi:lambda family phage portal protein
MLNGLRKTLSRLIAPKGRQVRMYASARASRLAGGQPSNSSADMELVSSLTALRSRSRQLVRDASYAKRAKVVVVNNVIGSGVGLQCQVKTTRGELNKPVNDAIEDAFCEWSKADSCHTGGGMHFNDFERAAFGQIFEAGEVFIRKHYRTFGKSRIPFALELIEAERIADETQPGPQEPGAMVRMGIEVDTFYRPIAYWIRERHQGEFRLGVQETNRYERVPADQIYHLRLIDRWPQTRGEPWLHAAVRRLQDIDGYSEAEIVAARGAANYFASIKLGDDPNSPIGEVKEDGSTEATMEPGIIMKLGPGEELDFHSPNRPNTAMEPFLRLMLREVAAGAGPSYESVSRDYSQSNYSSSRLGQLEDRDLWRVFQQWWIRGFRCPLHYEWLQQAVLARVIPQISVEAYASDPYRYGLARFKPRGWTWIDPTKEVQAFKDAVRNGFTTNTQVIAQTANGMDLEDVLEEREHELEQMHQKGLKFDTDPDRAGDGKSSEPVAAPAPTQNANAETPVEQVERFAA